MEVTVMKTLAKKENPPGLRGPSLVAKSPAFCFVAFSPSGAINARFDTLRKWCFQQRWHKLRARIFIRAILAQCDMQWTCKIAVIAQYVCVCVCVWVCGEAVRGRFTSHLKQPYDSMITRVTTKTRSKQKAAHLKKKRQWDWRGKTDESGGQGEEGGWAWWLLSGSQERFSPSIGVLKAPWIINGLSLRSHCPPVLLFLLMSLCSLPPSPSTYFSLCFHPSHLLIVSLSAAASQLHFCLSSLAILPHSLPAAAAASLTSSVFHLFPSSRSLLPSHRHPLSLHFTPASVHLFYLSLRGLFSIPAYRLIFMPGASFALLPLPQFIFIPPHATFLCQITTLQSSFVRFLIYHAPNGFWGKLGPNEVP